MLGKMKFRGSRGTAGLLPMQCWVRWNSEYYHGRSESFLDNIGWTSQCWNNGRHIWALFTCEALDTILKALSHSLQHWEGEGGEGGVRSHFIDEDAGAQKVQVPGSMSSRSVRSRVWIQRVWLPVAMLHSSLKAKSKCKYSEPSLRYLLSELRQSSQSRWVLPTDVYFLFWHAEWFKNNLDKSSVLENRNILHFWFLLMRKKGRLGILVFYSWMPKSSLNAVAAAAFRWACALQWATVLTTPHSTSDTQVSITCYSSSQLCYFSNRAVS